MALGHVETNLVTGDSDTGLVVWQRVFIQYFIQTIFSQLYKKWLPDFAEIRNEESKPSQRRARESHSRTLTDTESERGGVTEKPQQSVS